MSASQHFRHHFLISLSIFFLSHIPPPPLLRSKPNQKCMRFNPDATVWVAKQRILCTLNQSLKDVLNYGLFQPASNGREGKFLDEERILREYPQPISKGVPALEVNCWQIYVNHITFFGYFMLHNLKVQTGNCLNSDVNNTGVVRSLHSLIIMNIRVNFFILFFFPGWNEKQFTF